MRPACSITGARQRTWQSSTCARVALWISSTASTAAMACTQGCHYLVLNIRLRCSMKQSPSGGSNMGLSALRRYRNRYRLRLLLGLPLFTVGWLLITISCLMAPWLTVFIVRFAIGRRFKLKVHLPSDLEFEMSPEDKARVTWIGSVAYWVREALNEKREVCPERRNSLFSYADRLERKYLRDEIRIMWL